MNRFYTKVNQLSYYGGAEIGQNDLDSKDYQDLLVWIELERKFFEKQLAKPNKGNKLGTCPSNPNPIRANQNYQRIFNVDIIYLSHFHYRQIDLCWFNYLR